MSAVLEYGHMVFSEWSRDGHGTQPAGQQYTGENPRGASKMSFFSLRESLFLPDVVCVDVTSVPICHQPVNETSSEASE